MKPPKDLIKIEYHTITLACLLSLILVYYIYFPGFFINMFSRIQIEIIKLTCIQLSIIYYIIGFRTHNHIRKFINYKK